MLYKISEVSRMLHISTHSLRFWEKNGEIPKVKRSGTLQREYSEADVEQIKEFLVRKHGQG